MEIEPKYLSYYFYQSLGGALEEIPFTLLEYEVERIINKRTQNRLSKLEKIPFEVKMCANAMINCINSYQSDNSNKNISSESIDGYSISYVNSSQMSDVIKSKNDELEEIMRNYLANIVVENTPVLFLGVR